MGKWISVESELPKKEGLYLIYAPSADPESPLLMTAWYYPDNKSHIWGLVKCWANAVTHWMPLPLPPE